MTKRENTQNYVAPSQGMHETLQRAFDFYNAELFESRLPECIILVHRKRGAAGYFWAEQWQDQKGEEKMHEIAMNPELFGRTVDKTLSTLVHEMTHLEQQEFGTPSKGGYHNKEWAEMMLAVGLTPTTTGVEGGAMTGRKVTHMIDAGGLFDVATQKLKATGAELSWLAVTPAKKEKKKDLSKVKHTCPECGMKAWAKLGVRIMCNDCDEMLDAEDVHGEA